MALEWCKDTFLKHRHVKTFLFDIVRKLEKCGHNIPLRYTVEGFSGYNIFGIFTVYKSSPSSYKNKKCKNSNVSEKLLFHWCSRVFYDRVDFKKSRLNKWV